MKIIKYICLFLVTCLAISACGKDNKGEDPTPQPQPKPTECYVLLDSLWNNTSPLAYDSKRESLFNSIQPFADACTNTAFKNLLTSDANKYALTVRYDNILSCYDAAFTRILDALKNGRPATGEVVIWQLYNMGYVIQTPTQTFAIDIYHYRAEELVPYLDFLAITHTHADHKWESLMSKMYDLGKPVYSNFFSPQINYQYCSTVNADYSFGDCEIHTFITHHNNSTTNVPVTAFQISCGSLANNFVLLHSGDSNFIASEFDVTKTIDVYIPRYAPNELTENQVIGKVFKPKYVLLSHILELSHKDVSDSRWSLQLAVERASKLDCANSIVPFWGEKLVWKNGSLQ